MQAAFLEIGETLSGEPDVMTHSVRGLSPFALRRIFQHTHDGDLEKWLETDNSGEKEQCLLDFLNLGRLQMKSLQARFPRAFTKWTEEEDQALLDEYKRHSKEYRTIHWSELSDQFGRNPNALKLRLEYLGKNLGADAGRSRGFRKER